MSDDNFDGGGDLFDRIHPVDIGEEMQSSYIDYAMSVIVGRALPEVRDGLSQCTAAFCTRCLIMATGRSVAM